MLLMKQQVHVHNSLFPKAYNPTYDDLNGACVPQTLSQALLLKVTASHCTYLRAKRSCSVVHGSGVPRLLGSKANPRVAPPKSAPVLRGRESDASPHSPGTSVSITALAHGQSLSNLQLTAKFPQPRPGGAFYMRICIHELLSIRSSLRYNYALKLETSRRRRRSSISCNESPIAYVHTSSFPD